MTDKSLGQVAYDAHWSFYDEVSERAKRWETDADECDMVAWQAAAEAVVARLWGEMRPMRQSEQAIIKAAVWEYEAGLASPHLHKAVEAYEKEQG